MNIRNLLTSGVVMVFAVACTSTNQSDSSGMTFSDEPLTGKVIWNDLITEDIASAKTFYSGLFGWTFEEMPLRDGREYVIARSGDQYVAGILSVGPKPNEDVSRWLPYISIDNVDLAIDRSVRGGATVVAGPRDVSLGRVAAIIDPEGAVVGLARSDLGDPDDSATSAAPGRVVWSELLASDPAAASAFYRDVVGYDVEAVERRGGRHTFLSNKGVQRAGILERPADQIEPVWLTYFGVSDPRAAAARAASLGGTVVLPPAPDVREGSMAIVTDPAGAVLVLQKTSM
jgi:predicted enzyme related to lactoylglutathione lyase